MVVFVCVGLHMDTGIAMFKVVAIPPSKVLQEEKLEQLVCNLKPYSLK